MRIYLRAKRELNWIACFNATKAEASRRNATVRLSQGAQMRWSDRRARARVFVPRPVRLHSRSEEQQDKHLSLRLDASRDAVEITMTYEGVEYAIRAGLGRNEWVLLISFPDNVGGTPAW